MSRIIRKSIRALIIATVIGGYGNLAQAEDPVAKNAADVAAIKASAQAFVDAFNRGDAKALAAEWTDNGELYDDSGMVLIGRAAIEKAYAKLIEDHPRNRITINVQTIRFPAAGLAIEEGSSRVESPGAELPTSSRYSAFHIRENGVWKIAYARESGGSGDSIDDLGWLVGTWVAKSKDREVRISFSWNDSKTFLENKFSVTEGGKVAAGGVQEIGRDPRTGRLCSWVFSDDGGRGQAQWVRDGNRWIMESVGVTGDGAPTSSTNVLTRVNDNEFSWRSVNRRVGVAQMPDAAPITVTRVVAGK